MLTTNNLIYGFNFKEEKEVFRVYDWAGNKIERLGEFNSHDEAYDALAALIYELYPNTMKDDDAYEIEINEYYISSNEGEI